jgi:hypothetical protein
MPGRADTPARPSLSRVAFVALFGTTPATAIDTRLYGLILAVPFIVLAGLMIGLLLYRFVNAALAEKRLRPGAIVSCER